MNIPCPDWGVQTRREWQCDQDTIVACWKCHALIRRGLYCCKNHEYEHTLHKLADD
jgi:hypothetical protein